MEKMTKTERARRAEAKARYDANYAEIFGEQSIEPRRPKRTRMVWDADYEMLIDASKRAEYQANMFDEMKSDLPSPMLAPAFPEHRNMHTGEIVSDRRRHREILKQNGLVELGNENTAEAERRMLVEREAKHAKAVEQTVVEVVKAQEDGQIGYMRERLGLDRPKKSDLPDMKIDTSKIADGESYVRA